ncbi:MAG: replication initiator protein [Microviridae sp.]|nr:MAG: replication initiator protein [Microviridae sp.]
MCIGCRMRRASDWALRVMHEAQGWRSNCFVTLTYARDCLPPDASLCHEDFQKFMKRVRKHFGGTVRFYMCGEYGPLNQRPHYHACLFNADFVDRVEAGRSESGEVFYRSAVLDKLWPHGRASVQDLTEQTASYTARYIMSKQLGINADYGVRRPEYNAMSLKPGIGAEWFKRYALSDVYAHDFVIQGGVKRRPPKYYDKLFKRSKNVKFDEIEFAREKRAKLSAADNTDERRAVREQVHLAKVDTLKRNSA